MWRRIEVTARVDHPVERVFPYLADPMLWHELTPAVVFRRQIGDRRSVRQQLDQGMAPERLFFVIKSARPPTDCTEPETKRFIVSTPSYAAPDSTVSVADGAVIISGKGTSAMTKDGRAEAWFDPAKDITINFSANGSVETKSGALPLRHSIVVGGREYRFTIDQGAKSFAKVVYDSCAYP